jgi:imidazoleglycerol phosphate dehydratase HisB
MAQRKADVSRKTKETDIELTLNLDGAGTSSVSTGVGFLDHMLELLAKHGLFDLDIKATGDTHVDDHHTVEDVGICLGEAVKKSLGDKKGITRFGQACVPMDEALAEVVVDISGRGHCACWLDAFRGADYGREDYVEAKAKAVLKEKGETLEEVVEDLKKRLDRRQLLEEFVKALALNAAITLHISVQACLRLRVFYKTAD